MMMSVFVEQKELRSSYLQTNDGNKILLVYRFTQYAIVAPQHRACIITIVSVMSLFKEQPCYVISFSRLLF